MARKIYENQKKVNLVRLQNLKMAIRQTYIILTTPNVRE